MALLLDCLRFVIREILPFMSLLLDDLGFLSGDSRVPFMALLLECLRIHSQPLALMALLPERPGFLICGMLPFKALLLGRLRSAQSKILSLLLLLLRNPSFFRQGILSQTALVRVHGARPMQRPLSTFVSWHAQRLVCLPIPCGYHIQPLHPGSHMGYIWQQHSFI